MRQIPFKMSVLVINRRYLNVVRRNKQKVFAVNILCVEVSYGLSHVILSSLLMVGMGCLWRGIFVF